MPKTLHIYIPQPSRENWKAMKDAIGRFRIKWRHMLRALILGCILLVAYPTKASCQTTQLDSITVHGVVLGVPSTDTIALPGTRITIKHSNQNYQTDDQGKFEFVIREEANTLETILVFEFLGYETKELSLAELSEINQTTGVVVYLVPDTSILNELGWPEVHYTWDDYLSVDHWITRGWNWLRWKLFNK